MIKNQYKDGESHGYWEEYWSNGNLRFKGCYKDGKRYGLLEYYYAGDLTKQFYI